MEDIILKNYKIDLHSKYDRIVSLTKEYLNNQTVMDELVGIESLHCKAMNAKPEIMFYGIYNAGKSSVLNELLGSDQAKVNDIPTTDKIDKYEWNGYCIVDTPGVDAPIEHEKVTEEHLEHADVVLFVISAEGSHEYVENYRRLKAIADRGKKIIIVLNDKDGKIGGSQKECEELYEVKRKVVDNARTVGLKDEDYVIVEVNAKRARTGRLKQNEQLIQKSNIEILKKCIFSELRHMPTFDVLRRAIFEIEKHLDNIINVLEQSENSDSVQALNEFMERLRTEKKEARKEIASFIKRRSAILGNELPGIMWAHRGDGQEAINQLATEYQGKFLQDVQKQMQVILYDLLESLNVAADNLEEKVKKIHIDRNIDIPLENADIGIKDKVTTINTNSDWKEKLVIAVDELQKLLKTIDGPIVYSNGKDLASEVAQGAALAPIAEAVAKKIGKSVIGKSLAGTALAPLVGGISPVVGPIVVVLSIFKALCGNGNEPPDPTAENERNRRIAEAEVQARQELQQRCRYIAEDMGERIRIEVEILVNQIMDDVQRPFVEQSKQSKCEIKKQVENLEALRQLYGEYETVRYELGALD